jgi:hypothetical protein
LYRRPFDALVTHGCELGHVRTVQTGAPDVLGGIEERWQHADGFQDLEVPGWIAVARASRCGRVSRSMSRASTPWRASSAAANSPGGPAPMITSSRVTRRMVKTG